jgi:aminopeptidase N
VHRAEDGGHATIVSVAGPAREFAVELLRGASIAETEVGGTRIRVFHPRADPAMGQHLLEYAEGALRACSERFGPLSIAELDVVEAPLAHVLGMEHSGLVLVDASHKGVPYHRSQDHEWTVAHEVAHQWWAMDVGSDAGRQPWLDEALASWSADLYLEERYGEDAVAARRQLEIVEPTASLRARGLADVPANLEAWKYDLDQYAAIVYGRASLFFDRARRAMGDEAVFAALRAYHADLRDRTATAEDLLEHLRARAADPHEVDRLYTRWIAEGHGYEDLLGHPPGEE